MSKINEIIKDLKPLRSVLIDVQDESGGVVETIAIVLLNLADRVAELAQELKELKEKGLIK